MGDLHELNQLSSVGWRVVAIVQEPHSTHVASKGHPIWTNFALLERYVPCAKSDLGSAPYVNEEHPDFERMLKAGLIHVMDSADKLLSEHP
jgi:hypothetical protein